MQLRAKLQDVSEKDTLKLDKIFQLSQKRNKQYILVEEEYDLLITGNPAYQESSNIPVITLGAIGKFPDSKIHITPPLLAIRVLKKMDAAEVMLASDISEPTIAKPQSNTHTLNNITPPQVGVEIQQNSYNILVVDDSIFIHKSLELELQKAEFESNITFVESGEACLDCIKDKQFDLIFLDVMMPGIDGYETCTEIRKTSLNKKTPIIMLSAKTSPLDEVKGIMAGCTTYLTKPILHEDFQKLLIRIDKWLEEFKAPMLHS